MSGAIAATLLVAAGLYAGVTGARRLARGLRHAQALDVVRGIRRLVIALAAGAVAGGVLTGADPQVFGGRFRLTASGLVESGPM